LLALKGLGVFRNLTMGVDKIEGAEAAFPHRSKSVRARRLLTTDSQRNYKAETG
jgi:hypothetical protein